MGVGWMIITGIIWGVTNALMKRGTQMVDQKRTQMGNAQSLWWFRGLFGDWMDLLLTPQYSLPFALNLSMSLVFLSNLPDSLLSHAVPITNAVTFASTALTGNFLGERLRVGHTLVGFVLIVTGVILCSL